MKIILAVLGLVVFAGCQDLGDYPDSTAPKTTTPGTTGTGTTGANGRPDDYAPTGYRTILSARDLSCFVGEEQDISIQVSYPTGNWLVSSPLPLGMYFEPAQYSNKDGLFLHLKGNPTTPGKYQISIDLKNDHGTSRCWVTLTVVAGRQALSQ
jgi:hypothetical protein